MKADGEGALISIRALAAWMGAAGLAAGITIGMAISSPPSTNVGGALNDRQAMIAGPDDGATSPTSAQATEPGADQGASVAGSYRRPIDPLDKEIEMGHRHAIELNEMICAQTGQNCEFVEMMRRQHEERYGGR